MIFVLVITLAVSFWTSQRIVKKSMSQIQTTGSLAAPHYHRIVGRDGCIHSKTKECRKDVILAHATVPHKIFFHFNVEIIHRVERNEDAHERDDQSEVCTK